MAERPTSVELWFDPACPFCWVTSRWLRRVAPHRDLDITWRSISLFFRNDPPPESPFYEPTKRTRDLLRVVEAVRDSGHGDRIGDLYTEFGRFIHHRQQLDFDVAEVLASVGLDPGFAAALDDSRWDPVIRESMADGLGLTGDDVGTPLIAIDGPRGRVGLFGPVITELPDLDGALALWDAYAAIARTPGFFELKRTRTSGPTLPPEHVLDEAS